MRVDAALHQAVLVGADGEEIARIGRGDLVSIDGRTGAVWIGSRTLLKVSKRGSPSPLPAPLDLQSMSNIPVTHRSVDWIPARFESMTRMHEQSVGADGRCVRFICSRAAARAPLQ